VYGQPLGKDLGKTPRVFCAVPDDSKSFQFEASVYSNQLPRRMHVYVWLEPHPELASLCAQASSPIIEVASQDLQGHGSQRRSEWPCFKPDRTGSLGFTTAFHDDVPDKREVKQIHVRPRGYP
jgi:hypothetical protein